MGMKGPTYPGEDESKIKSSEHAGAVALVSSLTAVVVRTRHMCDQTNQQSSVDGVGLTGPTLVDKQSMAILVGESFFFEGRAPGRLLMLQRITLNQ